MLELSVEFFPPKTGKEYLGLTRQRTNLSLLASALRLLLMAQEVPPGRHLTAARELKKGLKKGASCFLLRL